MWDIESGVFRERIELHKGFTPTNVLHPPTYLNKVLIASEEGELQLWNVRSRRCVYTFKSIRSLITRGTTITAIAHSSAVDVIALGTSTGQIIVLNIREDVVLATFKHASNDGGVTALSFRSEDGAGGVPLLASGSGSGTIVFWDLQNAKLHSKLTHGHDGGVVSAAFLPRQPVLVTSGRDNAVKQWLLDTVDGSARLLRCRQGHTSPPSSISFYGGMTVATTADGVDSEKNCQLLSGGSDRTLRLFHTARPEHAVEFSQGSIQKRAKQLGIDARALKLPPVVAVTSSDARHRFWGNVLTAHENHDAAYVWSFHNRRLCGSGKKRGDRHKRPLALRPGNESGNVTCVAISLCGNMGIVGTSSGSIFKYNLQSGKLRGSIRGHDADVTGVAVAELNRIDRKSVV